MIATTLKAEGETLPDCLKVPLYNHLQELVTAIDLYESVKYVGNDATYAIVKDRLMLLNEDYNRITGVLK